MIKRFVRKNFYGLFLKIKRILFRIYKFKICPKVFFYYEEYVKDILYDFIGIPLQVLKTLFINNIVLNIFIVLAVLIITNQNLALSDFVREKLNGVFISIFTILNLTNSYLEYRKNQSNKKMASPFPIEILNVFYAISWQTGYFRTFGLGNTIITPKNSQAKNIRIDSPKFFKAKIEDILIYIKGANDKIEKFYLYFGFVRFMQENVHHIVTMNETIIPNLLQYENSANTKGRLAHLQRVGIYLVKKIAILNQFQDSIQILKLEEELRKIILKPREISIDTLEQDNIQQRQEKIALINQYEFSNKEVLVWKFNAEDLKQDLILFLNLVNDLYPIFFKEANIKKIKEK